MNESLFNRLWEEANIRFVNDWHLSDKPRSASKSLPTILIELVIEECEKVCAGLEDNLDRHKLPTPNGTMKHILDHFGLSK